jgi:hypothetical protein
MLYYKMKVEHCSKGKVEIIMNHRWMDGTVMTYELQTVETRNHSILGLDKLHCCVRQI